MRPTLGSWGKVLSSPPTWMKIKVKKLESLTEIAVLLLSAERLDSWRLSISVGGKEPAALMQASRAAKSNVWIMRIAQRRHMSQEARSTRLLTAVSSLVKLQPSQEIRTLAWTPGKNV